MLDIKFVRNNPDVVKENIKKKFQDEKFPLVDEVLERKRKYRQTLTGWRAFQQRKKMWRQISKRS